MAFRSDLSLIRGVHQGEGARVCFVNPGPQMLLPCVSCHRHIRIEERACPFCRASEKGKVVLGAALVSTLLLGCEDEPLTREARAVPVSEAREPQAEDPKPTTPVEVKVEPNVENEPAPRPSKERASTLEDVERNARKEEAERRRPQPRPVYGLPRPRPKPNPYK